MTNTPKLKEMLKLYSKKELWDRIQEKNKIIEELDHKIEILEKTLELACERVKYFEEMQDKEMGFKDFFGYESDYDLQTIIEQYKEQAESELKGDNYEKGRT
jgi:hypothetical protein